MAPDAEGKATLSSTTPDEEKEEETEGVVREGRSEDVASKEHVLRQELLEAREALVMAEQEALTALLAAREEARTRIASEGRVKSLEVSKTG